MVTRSGRTVGEQLQSPRRRTLRITVWTNNAEARRAWRGLRPQPNRRPDCQSGRPYSKNRGRIDNPAYKSCRRTMISNVCSAEQGQIDRLNANRARELLVDRFFAIR